MRAPYLTPIVIKVGGSLFDLDHLGSRLLHFIKPLPSRKVMLIPGGGQVAELIRDLDRRHHLGEETSHWLALRALTLNAHLLASLLPPEMGVVVQSPEQCPKAWDNGKVPILDAYAFALADEGKQGSLPHVWAVTSDSMAARVAVVSGAEKLILLKSVDLPRGIDWVEAGWRGLVDNHFYQVVEDPIKERVLEVEFLNFRS